MCAGAAKWLASRTTVELTPLQDFADFSPKFNVTSTTPSPAELLEQIHLRDEKGNFIVGARAIAISLTTSPSWYWRVVGSGMQMPVISIVADWAYKVIANNRKRSGDKVAH